MIEKYSFVVADSKFKKFSYGLTYLSLINEKIDNSSKYGVDIECFNDVIKLEKQGFIKLHCITRYYTAINEAIKIEVFISLTEGTEISSCIKVRGKTFLKEFPYDKHGDEYIDKYMYTPTYGTRLLGVVDEHKDDYRHYLSIRLGIENNYIDVTDEVTAFFADNVSTYFHLLGKRIYYLNGKIIGNDILFGVNFNVFDYVEKKLVSYDVINICFIDRYYSGKF